MNRRFLIDAAERIGATFVEAFAAAVALSGAFNLSVLKAALFAGEVAAASAIKTGAAKFVGSRDSASLAPSIGPTPAGDAQRRLQDAMASVAEANARLADADKQATDARKRLAAADPPRDLAPPVPVTVAAVAKKAAKKPTKKAGK